MCNLPVQHIDLCNFNIQRGNVLMFSSEHRDAMGQQLGHTMTPFVVSKVDRDSDNEVNLVTGSWLQDPMDETRYASKNNTRLYLAWGVTNDTSPLVGICIDPDDKIGNDSPDLGSHAPLIYETNWVWRQ